MSSVTIIHNVSDTRLMNRDSYVVIQENTRSIVSIHTSLEDAQEAARAIGAKGKAAGFVLKAVWYCAPKVNVSEGEL